MPTAINRKYLHLKGCLKCYCQESDKAHFCQNICRFFMLHLSYFIIFFQPIKIISKMLPMETIKKKKYLQELDNTQNCRSKACNICMADYYPYNERKNNKFLYFKITLISLRIIFNISPIFSMV